jgi:hypothetical protein
MNAEGFHVFAGFAAGQTGLNKMMLSSPDRGLGSAVHCELIKNMVDMTFYGMGADIQRLSDFHIRSATGKHLKYLNFPLAQRVR